MHEEVKIIFKTLLKVPVVVFVCYAIFNAFAFILIYFKLLGLSYVIQQTAVENNYIPQTELKSIATYMANFGNSPMVGDMRIILGTDDKACLVVADLDNNGTIDSNDINNAVNMLDSTVCTSLKRKQYGATVTVGLQLDYFIQWPLDYRETTIGETGVNGLVKPGETGDFKGFKSNDEILASLEDNRVHIDDIKIKYTVPGLKYYPDMNLN